MTIDTSDDKLRKLIHAVLADIEPLNIQSEKALSEAFLVSRVLSARDRVWETAADDIGQYDRTLNELQSIQGQVAEAERARPRFVRALTVSLVVVWMVVLSGAFITRFWVTDISWLHSWLSSLVIAAPAWSIMYGLLRFRMRKSAKRNAEGLRTSLGLEAARERLQILEDKVYGSVRTHGILRELREVINAEHQPSFGTALPALHVGGLSEVFDPVYEVPTNARQRVARMIDTMPGGAIGVSGERGAGKTTLLTSICRMEHLPGTDTPLLSVLVSAPVRYAPREFILHIFSSVCRRVLELKHTSEHRPTWQDLQRVRSPFASWALRLAVPLVALGMVMVALSLTAATIQGSSKSPTTGVGQGEGPTKPIQSGPREAVRDLIASLGMNPGRVLFWGFLFVLAGSAAMRFRGTADAGSDVEKDAPAVVRWAREWLREIRFQQSFSSGWTGSLQLPVGLKGGVNSTLTISQRQMTLPEIVQAFREFAAVLTHEFLVIIGIDELDKLASDDDAQQFLNEIKAIFGMEKCFYLMSISDSATARFELRGLALRDAFDSAFDDVVHVDSLTFEESRRLLSRRVVGLPVPFVCLCHCLSGGVARDVVRSCRSMFEATIAGEETPEVATLCRSMVVDELRAKVQALTTHVAGRHAADSLADAIRDLETGLNRSGFPLAQLRKAALELDREGQQPSPEVNRAQPDLSEMGWSAYFEYMATLVELFELVQVGTLAVKELPPVCGELARVRRTLGRDAVRAKRLIAETRRRIGLETAAPPEETP